MLAYCSELVFVVHSQKLPEFIKFPVKSIVFIYKKKNDLRISNVNIGVQLSHQHFDILVHHVKFGMPGVDGICH